MIPCHPSDVAKFDSPAQLLTRLTDAAPAPINICAWHEDLSHPRNKGANHVICAPCQAKAFAELDDDTARREAIEDASWDRTQRAIDAAIAKQDAPPPPPLPVGRPIAHDQTELTSNGWQTTAIAGVVTPGVSLEVFCIPFPAALEAL